LGAPRWFVKTLALTLSAVACACVLGVFTLQQPRVAAASASRVDLRDEIAAARADTWRWQRLTGRRLTRALPVRTVASASYQRWVLRLWRQRAAREWLHALHPPHLREFLCIHRFEGAWTDGGGPYYGGLQMDLSFQRLYGPALFRRKGTADHWTPLEQIWVAEKAHKSGRGFTPWPNTARTCGLL
jgi:hypothetical protein